MLPGLTSEPGFWLSKNIFLKIFHWTGSVSWNSSTNATWYLCLRIANKWSELSLYKALSTRSIISLKLIWPFFAFAWLTSFWSWWIVSTASICFKLAKASSIFPSTETISCSLGQTSGLGPFFNHLSGTRHWMPCLWPDFTPWIWETKSCKYAISIFLSSTSLK